MVPKYQNILYNYAYKYCHEIIKKINVEFS